jgi:hypothetical protein
MAVTYDVKAVLDDRQPTGRGQQALMIATTIPFAVLTPPLAGIFLGVMVLLRWDLRREPVWWGLVLAGVFLPWIYIALSIGFLALGGTKPRSRFHLVPAVS